MCGICGIYNRISQEIDTESIVIMRDVMSNRGPDAAGLHVAPAIGLGHRRLSIIDLSPAGHQPLSNEDETIWIVLNGEIYNFPGLRDELIERGHVFRSRTDTEVLIHGYEEWGIENLLKRINGMYAFAIWDSNKKELILARDRLGVKPLFFMEKNGKVYFSSDIKSIYLVCEKDLTIDFRAVDHFLYSLCIPQEYSIFQEIKKVLPAQYIKFNEGTTLSNFYWTLDFSSKIKMSEGEYIQQIESKLLQAVKRRMISDVPLGAFLSGGIDSSLVTAFMAKISDFPIKTFSIGFKNSSYNELKYAKMVAEKYSTEHHEFIVEPNALDILPEIIWSYGEPFADSSQIPTYYVAKITREYVKVALTGDGGDESFGGYRSSAAHFFANRYRKYLPSFLRNMLMPAIADALVSTLGKETLINKFKTITDYGRGSFIDTYRLGGNFDLTLREELYSSDFKEKLSEHDPTDIYKKYLESDVIDEVDKALYIDFKTLLPNDFLTKVDVATMMNSLEARSPFLDYELIEYSAKIPSYIKIKYGMQKYLLKKLARIYIPSEAIDRPKKGFGVPIGYWLRENCSVLMKEILLSEKAAGRGYFSMKFVEKLLNEHLNGISDHSHRLWSLFCLELWHLMFIDKHITAKTNLLHENKL